MFYDSINDAAEELGIPQLNNGQTEIWYARDRRNKAMPRMKSLHKTHILLGRVKEDKRIHDLYSILKDNSWTPNNEAKHLITKKGLKRTNMGVGDVIVMKRTGYVVDRFGMRVIL